MSMAARTIENPFREGHLLSVSTGAACLARVGRIDFGELASSFFRFGVQLGKECRPRGICNAFGQTMIVGHAVDAEVFYADDPEPINNVTALLMGEVLTPPSGPLMHSSHGFAVLVTLRCAAGQLGMLALDFRQGLCLLAKKARIGNLFTSGQGSKRLESNIYSNLFATFWQSLGSALYRKGDKPLACRRAKMP